MFDYKNPLETHLWNIFSVFKDGMDSPEYRNYIFGFLFFKYLSEKQEQHMNEELQEDEENTSLGYFLEPQYLFSNIIEKAKVGEFILDDLNKSLNHISKIRTGAGGQDDFSNLFEDVDLNSSKLGETAEERNTIISKILLQLDEIDFELDNEKSDILGDIYEHMIIQFASRAGKRMGEFYTPQEVSKILAKIVTLNKSSLKNVYDPTCGSGSLLLRVAKENKVNNFYGQELNRTSYNLARMNMVIHGVPFENFDIKQGDTLEDPQHIDQKFEAIVSNPPYSAKWSRDKKFLNDERFGGCEKLAPKTKADFAFVQHMLHQLDENGTMAIVLPQGVLFRGAAEDAIRKYLVAEKNYLDAVINLPPNLFYRTSINILVFVFKKNRAENQDIFFIDASKSFEKAEFRNKIKEEDITKIVNTYANREEIEKYSHKATIEEIKEQDYNLSLHRYVDTLEEVEPVDLDAVCDELEQITKEINEEGKEFTKYCDEFGIRAPVF